MQFVLLTRQILSGTELSGMLRRSRAGNRQTVGCLFLRRYGIIYIGMTVFRIWEVFMVFYFTGTGNTYAAAMELELRLKDRLFNIADCMKKKEFRFSPQEGEAVGILCPVYYGGLPSIVNSFLARLRFDRRPDYLYGLLTFGGIPGGSAGVLRRRMRETGYEMNAVWQLKMPANYAILYEPTSEEAEGAIFEEAELRLEQIVKDIKNRLTAVPAPDPAGRAVSAFMQPLYERARKTAPFYTDDQCVSCGACANRCPVQAIEMIEGTPTWVKDKCVFCMSCVRCGAIQYGEKLKGRYRYKHPVFRKKKKAGESCH